MIPLHDEEAIRPGADLALFFFAALFLGAGLLAAAIARPRAREIAQ